MKLSIITINYNDKKGLEKTIKSVVHQTYKDFEYIVIDGKSNDGSKEVIEQYKDYFDYSVSEPDTGIYNAMNKGIVKANGEYLQFLNSGDWFVDEFVLEKMFSEFWECDLLYGNCRIILPDGKIKIKRPLETELSFFTFLNDTLNHQSVFISHKLFKKYGLYDENLKIASDWKFFLKSIGLNRSKSIYKNIDIVYYNREGISSSNRDLLISERKKTIDEIIPATIQDFFSNYSDEYIRLSIIKKYYITSKMYRLSQLVLIRISRILDYFNQHLKLL